MHINRRGATRIVFVLARHVIKIPNFTYGWTMVLQGLLANLTEKRIWNYHGYTSSQRYQRTLHLCPVLYCSWGGWLLIMPRAEVCTDEQHIDFAPWLQRGWGGDDKPDNYGWLSGKLVKIDYGHY